MIKKEYKLDKNDKVDKLIEIFQHTYKISKNKYEPITEPIYIIPSTVSLGISKTRTKIFLTEKDCVKVARELVEIGRNVLLLNMASEFRPGGGVLKGSSAQEEHICRLSNLYLHLEKVAYPLEKFSAILSKKVIFFKNEETHESLSSEDIWNCDILTISAVRVNNPSEFTQTKYDITCEKIRLMLRTAIVSGAEILILSAFGCGAYGNPNNLVSKAFHQVLLEEKPNINFNVVFAIINDKNSDNNFQVFEETFFEVLK